VGTAPMPSRTPSTTLLQYRLDVLGVDTADVVSAAGGWLFDRAMAGWAVEVWLADIRDTRPLHILGAAVHHLAERGPAEDGAGAGLAVSGALMTDDRAVGAEVAGVLRTGHTEVVGWGATWPQLCGGRAGAVRYHLSAAARVFKRQALIASGSADTTVGPTEALISGGHRPLQWDLAAVRG
jgi:hypothetical protein